ncbi:MAG: hypothetical protein J5515_07740 [Lachnospiraceae bacterium]|nr:hypothetical protein [Lachnospiraceae bacterium]
MAKIERTAKGKKKNVVATVFIIILTLLLVLEGIALCVIWIPYAVKRKKSVPTAVVLAKENPGREYAGEASSVALEEYIYASLLNEKVARYGEVNEENYEDFKNLYLETGKAWENAAYSAGYLYEIGDIIENEEKKGNYSGVYGSSKLVAKPMGKSESIDNAEELIESYDTMAKGSEIKTLANVLSVDSGNAYQLYSTCAEQFEIAEADWNTWIETGYDICMSASSSSMSCNIVGSELLTGDANNLTGIVSFSTSPLDSSISVANNGKASIILGEDYALAKQYSKDAVMTGITKSVTINDWIPQYETDETLIYYEGFKEETGSVKYPQSIVYDFDGSVKIVTASVSNYENKTLEEIEKVINDSLSAGNSKLKEARIAVSSKEVEKMAVSVLREAYAENNGTELSGVDLSLFSDYLLESSIEKYREKVSDYAQTEEYIGVAEYFYNEVNLAAYEGRMLSLEEFVILEEPTVYDIEGAWEVTMTVNNVRSGFMDVVGTVAGWLIGEDAVNEAASDFYAMEETVTVNVNIVATGSNTVEITSIGEDENGEMIVSTTTGTMKKGVVYLDNPDEEDIKTTEAYEEDTQLVFYGYGDDRYMSGSGTYVLKLFDVSADIYYYGTRTSADELWTY